MQSDEATSTPSGIVTTASDERVIPASRRSDGTLRKERRVRPGFVPDEDVQRYKTRHSQESRGLPAGVVVGYTPEPKKQPMTKAQKKNEKRKKRRELKEGDVGDEDVTTDALAGQMGNLTIADDGVENVVITLNELETRKKLKNLEKKIRQIERLKEKLLEGEDLLAEQREKVRKLPQFQEELKQLQDTLGFNGDSD